VPLLLLDTYYDTCSTKGVNDRVTYLEHFVISSFNLNPRYILILHLIGICCRTKFVHVREGVRGAI